MFHCSKNHVYGYQSCSSLISWFALPKSRNNLFIYFGAFGSDSNQQRYKYLRVSNCSLVPLINAAVSCFSRANSRKLHGTAEQKDQQPVRGRPSERVLDYLLAPTQSKSHRRHVARCPSQVPFVKWKLIRPNYDNYDDDTAHSFHISCYMNWKPALKLTSLSTQMWTRGRGTAAEGASLSNNSFP